MRLKIGGNDPKNYKYSKFEGVLINEVDKLANEKSNILALIIFERRIKY